MSFSHLRQKPFKNECSNKIEGTSCFYCSQCSPCLGTWTQLGMHFDKGLSDFTRHEMSLITVHIFFRPLKSVGLSVISFWKALTFTHWWWTVSFLPSTCGCENQFMRHKIWTLTNFLILWNVLSSNKELKIQILK